MYGKINLVNYEVAERERARQREALANRPVLDPMDLVFYGLWFLLGVLAGAKLF